MRRRSTSRRFSPCRKFPATPSLRRGLSRTNILIQAKKVLRIVLRLDCDHTIPSFTIRLGNAILLIATHEIYVDTRLHRRPKFPEETSNPRDVAGIGGWVSPVGQQIQDERSAAISEGGLVCSDQPRRSSEIGKFDLSF